MLSHTKHVVISINDKVNSYHINTPEALVLKIGNADVKFDYLQFWVNKNTNKFIFLESEVESNETKNQEIIKNLKQTFKMIDLTDKERLNEDIKDKKPFYTISLIYSNQLKCMCLWKQLRLKIKKKKIKFA